jgi:hypothetical protein
MIIAISGKKQSGKDTVASILTHLIPYCGIYHFASPLKAEVARATGCSEKYIEDHKPSFRTLLQGWGDYRKAIYGQDYYVQITKEAIVRSAACGITNCIIPDLRFNVEMAWVKSVGGITIRVERNIQPVSLDIHRSETELDGVKFDHTIENNGTIEDLIEKVKQLKLI